MKSTLITVYILFIDATTLIALIVSAILDSDVSAWILIGLFMAHSISYHVVSVYLFRLIHRIRVCRIPTPHGRLIDADALMKECQRLEETEYFYDSDEEEISQYLLDANSVEAIIEEAPTVVSAAREVEHG